MGGKLLEIISDEMGVLISDLRFHTGKESNLIAVLRTFPMRKYSLEEWNYVFSYIFDKSFQFQNYKQVEDYLKNNLPS